MKKDSTRFVRSSYAQFTMIPNFVHDLIPRMGTSAYAVYSELAWIAGSDPTCYPSVAHIARATGLSPVTVQKAIKTLAELELVHVEVRFRTGGSQTSNFYTLLDASNRQSVAHPPVEFTPPPVESGPLEPYTNNQTTQSEIEYTPHTIVQWWMDRHHMKTIANSVMLHKHAKLLIQAGLEDGEAEKLYDWIASDDYWKHIPISLWVMYRQYNAWRAAGSPARARSYVPDV